MRVANNLCQCVIEGLCPQELYIVHCSVHAAAYDMLEELKRIAALEPRYTTLKLIKKAEGF